MNQMPKKKHPKIDKVLEEKVFKTQGAEYKQYLVK